MRSATDQITGPNKLAAGEIGEERFKKLRHRQHPKLCFQSCVGNTGLLRMHFMFAIDKPGGLRL